MEEKNKQDKPQQNEYLADQYNACLLTFKRPNVSHLKIQTRTQEYVDLGDFWDSKTDKQRRDYLVTNKGLGTTFRNLHPIFKDEVLKTIAERQNNAFQAWIQPQPTTSLVFELTSKLQVGTGIASMFETHIQLHHLYGIPWIPSSSLKGAVRSWTIFRYFQGDEERALKDSGFSFLFGNHKSNDGLGAIAFGDAFPFKNLVLERDIINVHYKNYYDGKGLPKDTESPTLINFLTVKTGAQFRLSLGQIKHQELSGALSAIELKAGEDASRALSLMTYLLVEALQEWGIGAKTSLGMGRCTLIKT